MFRVSTDDLLTLNMGEIILQYLLSQQVNESLNVFSHLSLISGLLQLREVDVRECGLEKLDVECIAIFM